MRMVLGRAFINDPGLINEMIPVIENENEPYHVRLSLIKAMEKVDGDYPALFSKIVDEIGKVKNTCLRAILAEVLQRGLKRGSCVEELRIEDTQTLLDTMKRTTEEKRGSDDSADAAISQIEKCLNWASARDIARMLGINIKLARHLVERGGFERILGNAGFRDRMNNLAYNLNRERTYHYLEPRLGEDEKTSLLDILFSLESVDHAKAVFDEFFRNAPEDYQIEISELNELLQYLTIEDMKVLIRTVRDDPKAAYDALCKKVSQNVSSDDPHADVIVKKAMWRLQNLFVSQEKIGQLGPIVEALKENTELLENLRRILEHIEKAQDDKELKKVAKSHGISKEDARIAKRLAERENLQMAELVLVLSKIDKARSFSGLVSVADEMGVDVVKLFLFKLGSITSVSKEDLFIDAFCTLDLLDTRDGDKQDLYGELSRQYGFLPLQSKVRIFFAVLFSLTTDNDRIWEAVQDLKKGKMISGFKRPFVEKFLSDDIFIMPSEAKTVFEGVTSAFNLEQHDKKEAYKQLRNLFKNRKYSSKKLDVDKNPMVVKRFQSIEKLIKLSRLSVSQIPHVFYEHVLKMKLGVDAIKTFRDFIDLVNHSPDMCNETGERKLELYQRVNEFVSVDHNDSGKVFTKLLNISIEESGGLTPASTKKVFDLLVVYLDKFATVLRSHIKANGCEYTEEVCTEIKALCEDVLQNLLSEGRVNREKIKRIEELIKGEQINALVARFQRVVDIGDEKTALEVLSRYVDQNPRFKWTDIRDRDILKLIDLYLDRIDAGQYAKKFEGQNGVSILAEWNKHVYANIWGALQAEMRGEFEKWKYEGKDGDYLATIDEIIKIEIGKLPEEEGAKARGILEAAKGKTLYEKLQNAPELDELRTLVEKVRKWEDTIRFTISGDEKEYTAEFTGDFYTLFNIANSAERWTACQSCVYPNDLNRGLTGYVVNGTNKAIVILDENKRVITRRIVRLRIMEDELGNKKPVIYVEENNQFGSRGIKKLYEVLDALSQKTGLPIVMARVRPSESAPKEGRIRVGKLVLFRGRSEFDYSDSYGHRIKKEQGHVAHGLFKQKDAEINVVPRVQLLEIRKDAEKEPPSAATKWLKRLTPGMLAPIRNLVVAPVVEEPIYRLGLPLLISVVFVVLFGEAFAFNPVTLGFYVAQIISAIVFTLHHEKGERAPPIVVSLINIGILPLITPNAFVFLLLAILSHSIVNLIFGGAKPTSEEIAERLKQKALNNPESLTLEEAIDTVLIHFENTSVLLKASKRLTEFDPSYTLKKIAARALAEKDAGNFNKYMRAMSNVILGMAGRLSEVDSQAVEEILLDCIEYSNKFQDEGKAAKLQAITNFNSFSKFTRFIYHDKKRVSKALPSILEFHEKDLFEHADDRTEWTYKLGRFGKFLSLLNKLFEKANFEEIPPEFKGTIIRMLENPAFIEDYEIRLKLLMVLESALRIENKENIQTEKRAIRKKLHGMFPGKREEFSMRQLDNAASVMDEIREAWNVWAEHSGEKEFDNFIDRAISGIWNERKLITEQKIRFEIALRDLKARRLALTMHALKMGKFSITDCDPHDLLKTITGVDFSRNNRVKLRYDAKTPFTVYFELGSREEFLSFRRELDEGQDMGSEQGVYKSDYGISFGFKDGNDDPFVHEVQHAFYDAVAIPPAQRFRLSNKKLNDMAKDFSNLVSEGKYEEAEGIIHTIADIVKREMRDEFIAYLLDGRRLSDHFLSYMKGLGMYRDKGVIVLMSESIDGIGDTEKKAQMRDCFKKAFGSLHDPKIKGYVCETIIENEEIASDFIKLAGKEHAIALLHLIPLNKLHRLVHLFDYYKERYKKGIDADLDKVDELIDGYVAAQKAVGGKSFEARLREVYREFEGKRDDAEKSRRITELLQESESDGNVNLKVKIFSSILSVLFKVGKEEQETL
ncbi:MAG: CPBP family intramembrane glutamic endopeptidase, partial [Candidatus Omnitrophota bacterium]